MVIGVGVGWMVVGVGDDEYNVGSSIVLGMLWKLESDEDSHCMRGLVLCVSMGVLVVDE